MKEMLEVLPNVKNLVKTRGEIFTASFLRHLGPQLYTWFPDEGESIAEFFNHVESLYSGTSTDSDVSPLDTSLFQSLHVAITPTTIFPEGACTAKFDVSFTLTLTQVHFPREATG